MYRTRQDLERSRASQGPSRRAPGTKSDDRYAPGIDRQMTDQALFFNMGVRVKKVTV